MEGRKDGKKRNGIVAGLENRKDNTQQPLFLGRSLLSLSRKWTLLGRLETPSKPGGWIQFDFLFLSLMLVDSSCATLVQSGYGPSRFPVWSSS